MLIKKGQRYRWNDGEGIVQILEDKWLGDEDCQIVKLLVVEYYVGAHPGDLSEVYAYQFDTKTSTHLILLVGQDAPLFVD